MPSFQVVEGASNERAGNDQFGLVVRRRLRYGQTNRMASRHAHGLELIRGKVLEVRPYAFVVGREGVHINQGISNKRRLPVTCPMTKKQFED